MLSGLSKHSTCDAQAAASDSSRGSACGRYTGLHLCKESWPYLLQGGTRGDADVPVHITNNKLLL